MSVFIDRKYLLLISSKLRNFKDKGNDLYNFSCAFCGDSQKNRLKARGYMFCRDGKFFYMCHNCNISLAFPKFLKETEPTLYKEYLLERFGDKSNVALYEERKAKKEEQIKLAGPKPQDKFVQRNTIKIPSVDQLEKNHPLRIYIEERLIPERFWKEIYYAEDFKGFMDSTFPVHGKDLIDNDPRLVLFYRNRG